MKSRLFSDACLVPAFLLLALVMSQACSREARCAGLGVSLTVEPGSKAIADGSVVENAIVFLCSETGGIIDMYRMEADGSLYVPVEYGRSYELYALTSACSLPLKIPSGPLRQIGDVLIEDMSDAMYGNVMSGRVSVNVSDYRTEITVPVRSIMARIDLHADFSSLPEEVEYVVERVSVRQCCRVQAPFLCPELSPECEAFDAGAIPDHILSVLQEGGTAGILLPENRRGVVAGVNSPWQKTPSYLKDACGARSIADHATYLEIQTSFTDRRDASANTKVLFRFYPGENATTDFNLTRNTIYDVVFSPSADAAGYIGNWKVSSLVCNAGADMEAMGHENLVITY